jgi:hypothetical protein
MLFYSMPYDTFHNIVAAQQAQSGPLAIHPAVHQPTVHRPMVPLPIAQSPVMPKPEMQLHLPLRRKRQTDTVVAEIERNPDGSFGSVHVLPMKKRRLDE